MFEDVVRSSVGFLDDPVQAQLLERHHTEPRRISFRLNLDNVKQRSSKTRVIDY